MASKAINARASDDEALPAPPLVRQIAWVIGAAAWAFLTAAVVSFDSADAPSHVVAAHHEPIANWCGTAGAWISYWSFLSIGMGVWVVVLATGGLLAVTVTGRVVTHPLVRAGGLCFIIVAVAGFHRLLLPEAGPLAGAKAGLVAEWIVPSLVPQFHRFGTGLILFVTLVIGLLIAVDQLVLALPAAMWRLFRQVRRLGSMSDAAIAEATAEVPTTRRRPWSRRKTTASIDPDAGGVGATEAFDPDDEAYEVADDDEYDDEYEYEEEDEYEDEEEPEYEDDADAELDEEEEEPSRKRLPLSAEELRQKIAKLPLRMAGRQNVVARDEDIPREESFEGYEFPTLELLVDPESNYTEKLEADVREQAQHLEESLQTYGIDGEVVAIESGPTVTLYAIQLAPGTKVAKINAISSDLARSMRSQNVRVVPNMVGRTTIGIEVPNRHREKVRLKELMSGGHAARMGLPMFLGKDASGEPLVSDLTRMPHMLIAGTTGSGKSVCMNTIIMSWLYTKRPDELKLVLVDPKMVELSQFSDVPHLMCPVVTEMPRAAAILEWAVTKMEERYELLSEARVRDITGYNKLDEDELYERFEPSNDLERAKIPKKLPYMVFVIDELADLMMTTKEVEQSIVRIAQKARAVGIHLILATQRPQANVVTGLIKSNMPGRISFKVASGMDSRIVLDHKGAELLLGQGDMLFLAPHTTELRRAQGTLVEDAEIRHVAKFLKDIAGPSFERSLISLRPKGGEGADGELSASERDPLFDAAVEIMIESGRGSVSLLQRRLAIGYSRSSRLIDQMWQAGIIGEHKGSVAREVLITLDDWRRMKAMEEADEAEGTVFASQAEPAMVETVGRDNGVHAE